MGETERTDEYVMAYLARPFRQVKRRKGPGNQDFEFIDAYMVANRLDDAAGPANWEAGYRTTGSTVYCRIAIHLPSGRKIRRGGASGFVERPNVRDWTHAKIVKTAFSEAFKKAAEAFGVGRYLKTGGRMPAYYRPYDAAWNQRQTPDVPAVPPLDAGTGKTSEPPEPDETPSRGQGAARPGAELYKELHARSDREEWFACAREYSEIYGWPARIIDWAPDQIAKFRINTGLNDQQMAGVAPGGTEFNEFQGQG